MECAKVAAFALSLFALEVEANNDFFADIDVGEEELANETVSSFDTQLYIQQKVKYGVNEPDTHYFFHRSKPGLSKVQSDLFFEVQGGINTVLSFQFSAKAEVDWGQWNTGDLEWQSNNEKIVVKDAYLDAVFENGVWLRLGNQVFAWGESEGLAISDVIAPNDLREIGQSELRDIREPVPALLVSIPLFSGKFNLVTTYDAGHNRYADIDEEFYLYRSDQGLLLTMENEPEKDWELVVKYDYQFNGGDISLVIAETNSNDFVIGDIEQGSAPTAQLIQYRVRNFALSGSKVKGNWLFKGEMGNYWDLILSTGTASTIQVDEYRLMAGLEYSGWNDWQISYEINTVKRHNLPDNYEDESSGKGHVLRVQWDTFNDRLSQQFWYTKMLNDNGAIGRYDISYDWNDHLETRAGLVIYKNSDMQSQLYPFRKNDSVNLTVKYSF